MESSTPSRDTAWAMSEENVEIVRNTLAAFERAIASYWQTPRSMAEGVEAGAPEFEEALGLLDPDIVWNAGDLGSTRGRQQMAALLDDLFEIADAYEISLTEIREGEGDLVYAAVERAITAKGSGIATKIPVFIAFRIENGLIAQMDEYLDRHKALEAAGLSE
jgi:ketosteroid isomerase-like protein